MSVVSAGLGAIIDALTQPQGAGGDVVTNDTLGPTIADIALALSIIKDTMDSADRNVTEAVTAATDAATQIEEIGSNVRDITEHTYAVVIPHSLSWLAGYVVTHWIDPIRTRLEHDESQIRFLLGWRNQIDAWRHGFVDPNVEKWVGFHQWFVTWPQSVLFRWHEWFAKPAEFAQWAAPPLIGPIVSYLAAKDHRVSRDNLMLIILRAMQEDVEPAWDAILRFLVTDK